MVCVFGSTFGSTFIRLHFLEQRRHILAKLWRHKVQTNRVFISLLLCHLSLYKMHRTHYSERRMAQLIQAEIDTPLTAENQLSEARSAKRDNGAATPRTSSKFSIFKLLFLISAGFLLFTYWL